MPRRKPPFAVPKVGEASYGTEIAAAVGQILRALREVEKRHEAYFASLTAQAPEGQRPIRLHDFYVLRCDKQGLTFHTVEGLRNDIVAECQACLLSGGQVQCD